MTWVLGVVVVWLAVSVGLALLVGRAIRAADQRTATPGRALDRPAGVPAVPVPRAYADR